MIIKQDFEYSPNGQNRPLHIYLPNDYYDSSERYPVMYFFDGHNLFYDSDATYGKSWGLREFLDSWDKKIIIVGMECCREGTGRLSEYLPYRAFRGMFRNMDPLGDATMQWIVESVKPYIDSNYRTWSHREATAIGGSSMGGLMSIYALTHYNRIFSKGACISSAVGVCMPLLMNDMKASYIHPDTRAFLSWGTLEANGVKDIWQIDTYSGTYRRNKAVFNKFAAQNALPQLYCQICGRHCEADWEKQVSLFMEYLWK